MSESPYFLSKLLTNPANCVKLTAYEIPYYMEKEPV